MGFPPLLQTTSSRRHRDERPAACVEVSSDLRTEFDLLATNSLTRDVDGALGQHFLNADAESEAEVELDGMTDDLSRKPAAYTRAAASTLAPPRPSRLESGIS